MKDPEIFQLFVYGSLRKGFKSPLYEYISSYFTFLGDARVRGKLFDMGSYPAGVPTRDNTFITGELYKLIRESDFSWVIGQLDDYEGVNVEPDEMQLYRREIAEVFLNGELTHAWIYWYNGDVSGKPLIASGDIFQYMQQKK
jgi:gamma-glutamylcyclotransferase (GGCT)/AIG2-like uncharacterized protein YtfP